jgi:hypothetical protein
MEEPMWTRISSVLAEAIVGLLAAGVVVAVLVPAVGEPIGSAVALAIAVAAVVLAVLVGERVRQARKPGPD